MKKTLDNVFKSTYYIGPHCGRREVMGRGGQFLGGVLIGILASTILFFGASQVALSWHLQSHHTVYPHVLHDVFHDDLAPQVDPALKQRLFQSPSPTHKPKQQAAITYEDLDRLFDRELVAVAGPADATPEELIETILADPSLPTHIRAPFVKLANTKKAAHLVPDSEVQK
mgnify:CR=1 FL=1